jgi:hypothetical protein
MKTCVQCDNKFAAEDGQINEEGKFVCLSCAEEGPKDEASVCPECGQSSEEFEASGECPDCGYEREEEELDEEDEAKEGE